ncbi:MAG: peptidoglycan DD-metalloendopeptidase family protein [Gammaproteobacteria bacterium]|nr:peptidoglycan DD-metalloendopeptidase family protein [Gammaproteobacteria bacterium]
MCNRILLFITMLIFLNGCDLSQGKFAPVTNGWKSSAASQAYRVQQADTLYSIAFRFGLDVNQLAAANHIPSPYRIHPGQMINLLPGATDSTVASTGTVSTPVVVSAAPMPAKVVSTPVVTQPVATGPIGVWAWPASGKIIQNFSDTYGGNKGIDIAGNLGDPVRATAGGRVVYCGTGLRGYGLLIIIKHNTQYLSAYAHNSQALVKEGQLVKQNQTIAKMGSSDATHVMLHFEIRQSGHPVDPLKLLPPRKGN